MSYGDIVTITSTGVVVREKALQPLGIYDESICWGVWAANPHQEHRHHKHPNLIISPFHPSSWPFLISIRLILENRQGVLAEASKLLEKNNLSIVFAECTPTGFAHATWTVIAESTWDRLAELRKRKEAFDLKNPMVRLPDNKNYYKARALANSIAAVMLTHVRNLEQVFSRIKERTHTSPLLHEWRAERNSHFLYDSGAVAKEMSEFEPRGNVRYIESQIPSSFSIRYMQRLAYFSIYGGGKHDEVPFKFEYKASEPLIKVESKVPIGKGLFDLKPLPMPAIGTFSSEDKYLRLCPVTPKFLKRSRLTRINVDYEVKRPPARDKQQRTHDAKASQGLLRLVCDELREASVDLLHISNKWTKHGYDDEAGLLSFIADVEQQEHQELEAKLAKSINDARPEHLKAATITDVRVYNYAERKLFLSLRFGHHPREASIRQLVEKIAQEEGFAKVVVVETYIDRHVSETVKREIEGCDAFLQVLYADEDKSPEQTNFRWLNKEYTMAAEANLEIIRLVDTVKATYKWWKAWDEFHDDHYPRGFRTDVSDDELSEELRQAIKALAKKLGIQ